MVQQSSSLIGILSVAGMPIGSSLDPYTGSYEVTPKVTAQILYTEDKRMTDDLTVKSIPYYETTNPSGITVIIGDV